MRWPLSRTKVVLLAVPAIIIHIAYGAIKGALDGLEDIRSGWIEAKSKPVSRNDRPSE